MYDFFLANADDRPPPTTLLTERVLDELLQPFASVFEKPNALPPSRPDDHAINLSDDDAIPPWRPWEIYLNMNSKL